MKVLTVEAAFRLPKKFSGTTTDALRMMVDYLDSKKVSLPGSVPGATCHLSEDVWKGFWNMPRKHRISIGASVTNQPERT